MYKAFKKVTLALCIMAITVMPAYASNTTDYIEKYKALVASLSAEYGIPISIITAISVIESGAGKSRNCILLKNHFGIIGKNKLLKTKGIRSKFKQYKTDEDSFRDFCKMISRKKYYTKLKGSNDYKAWINAMAKAGYSTTPEVWKREIFNAIKRNNLTNANIPTIVEAEDVSSF